MLTPVDSSSGSAVEALRALLVEAERIRLELVALDDARQQRRETQADTALRGWIAGTLEAAAEVLEALAADLAARPGHISRDTAGPLGRIEAAVEALQQMGDREQGATPIAAILAHVEALGGQLRAATRLVGEEDVAGAPAGRSGAGEQALGERLRAHLVILRANFTVRSAACRHALRLAGCLAVADALARGLALPRAYWVPMTAALVLKPDFASTYSRGLGRMAGTGLGLIVTTALVAVAFGSDAGKVALAGILVFIMRSPGPANYGLFTIAVTGFVVVLTSFAGARPEATIVERGISTLIGGALALGVYALWPTWEHTQNPAILADLLDAYRRYFGAVMAAYLDSQRQDLGAVDEARLATRLARTNAEASVTRLRSEPALSAAEPERAAELLATSHRLARGIMALDAGLYHDTSADLPPPAVSALRDFSAGVDTTLEAFAATLRDPSSPLIALPSLRADLRALPGTLGARQKADEAPPGAATRLAILVSEADRVTDSVNTLTALVRQDRI